MSKFKKFFGGESSNPETIQQLQQEFNGVIFQMGQIAYRRHIMQCEVKGLDGQLNTLFQRADTLGKQDQVLRQRAQKELADTIKKSGQSQKSEGNHEEVVAKAN